MKELRKLNKQQERLKNANEQDKGEFGSLVGSLQNVCKRMGF